ncbi:hypothetical protein V6N00_13705 [Tersicoccus sp. MR15.9]|uniref:hypothetical protein n=1 Tax=Tersicoccus mangrovi TaxID=3121635 RepID=UPI002FE6B10F
MGETAEALRAWAKGMYATEAAVELLIRANLGVYASAPWIVPTGDSRAALDPDALLDGSGAWSGGERRLVAIVVSLLGAEPVNLAEALPGLDREHLDLLLAALAHAAGSHEHSGLVTDETGRPTGFTRLDTLYPWPAASAAH